jgi:hypothetical protein
MLVCVRERGDPGHIWKFSDSARWERTWRSLQRRGLVEDNRTIAEDGETVIIGKGGPWKLSEMGEDALRRTGHSLIDA